MSVATAPSLRVPVITVDGGPLDALRSRLAGELLTSVDAGYDDARRTQSITVDRHPLAIVRAATARDVAAAVDFARERGLPLAVRSGGHSVAHHSMIDGAVVVDLSQMKRVLVDPEARTARVQGGATSADIAGPAYEHNLALSTGDTASVGIGGLTTGGGVGFMVRRYGLAIDNLLAAEVVTAGGEIIVADEKTHADLFWAIRGGGGNVGIVTEFTFRLAPVGQILGGLLVLPGTREAIRGYLDAAIAAPDDLTTIANLMPAPPLPFVPQEFIGKPVLAVLVTWTGEIEAGQQALAPFRALAEPVADLVGPMPYPEMYRLTDHQAGPHGAEVRMMFADDLSDETIDAALNAVVTADSPFSVVQLRGLGGAMARVDPAATAFAHRERKYFVAILRAWFDPSEDATPHQVWAESLWRAIRHDGKGVYVNFLGEEGEARVREAYPGATYDRLAAVKAAYDPENLFRFNQNVAPKA
jgi:FAD/FMN-containing dehydrogenase